MCFVVVRVRDTQTGTGQTLWLGTRSIVVSSKKRRVKSSLIKGRVLVTLSGSMGVATPS